MAKILPRGLGFVLASVLIQLTVSQPCSFAPEYRGLFWRRNDPSGNHIFFSVYETGYDVREGATTTETFTCDADTFISPFAIAVVDSNVRGNDSCLSAVLVGQAVFYRFQDAAVNDPPIADCVSVSPQSQDVVIRYPFDFEPGNCGLADGVYATTYAGDFPTPYPTQCANNPQSQAVINGDTITMNTCFQGTVSYASPLRGEFQCLARANPAIFGGDTQSGDMLVLTYNANNTDYFYCARYKEDGTAIDLSLAFTLYQEIHCDISATASSTNGVYFRLQSTNCDQGVCLNGATCSQDLGTYTCECAEGWSGDHCEILSSCLPDYCYQGGTCIVENNLPRCICDDGYTGRICETDIDECETAVCENLGSCEQGINKYHCICRDDYIGDHCQYRDPCLSSPCEDVQTCIISDYGKHECEGPRAPKPFPWKPVIITACVFVGVCLIVAITYIIIRCCRCACIPYVETEDDCSSISSISSVPPCTPAPQPTKTVVKSSAKCTESRKVTVSIPIPQPAPQPAPEPVQEPKQLRLVRLTPVRAMQAAPMQTIPLQAAPMQAIPVQAAPYRVAPRTSSVFIREMGALPATTGATYANPISTVARPVIIHPERVIF